MATLNTLLCPSRSNIMGPKGILSTMASQVDCTYTSTKTMNSILAENTFQG